MYFGRLSEANPSAWLQFGLLSPGAEDLRSALQGTKAARVALGICTSAHHHHPPPMGTCPWQKLTGLPWRKYQNVNICFCISLNFIIPAF